jgi:hypothetical protein
MHHVLVTAPSAFSRTLCWGASVLRKRDSAEGYHVDRQFQRSKPVKSVRLFTDP